MICPKTLQECSSSACSPTRCHLDYFPKPEPLLQPWICPRCQKVHGPYSMQCDCRPLTVGGVSNGGYVQADPSKTYNDGHNDGHNDATKFWRPVLERLVDAIDQSGVSVSGIPNVMDAVVVAKTHLRCA